jgi:hypothetical protein
MIATHIIPACGGILGIAMMALAVRYAERNDTTRSLCSYLASVGFVVAAAKVAVWAHSAA